MKINLLLILMLMGQWITAQTVFDWASAPQGVEMEYIHLEALPDGGIFAVSDNDRLNEMRHPWFFVDGKGKHFEDRQLAGNENTNILMRFDRDGALLWWQSWREENISIVDTEMGKDGKIYMLVYVEYDDYFNDYDYDYYEESETDEVIIEYGAVPNQRRDDYIKTPVGYAFVRLSQEGVVEQVISLEQFNDMDSEVNLVDFELYGDDQYVVAGDVDEGTYTENLDLPCNGVGGDFIMLLDNEGKKVWWDIIVNRKFKYCSSDMEANHLSVAKDGTIYFGVSYVEGACFSNGMQKVAPVNYKVKQYGSARESYVVSYSPNGKMNWIKMGEGNSHFIGLTKTKSGVCLVHRLYEDVRSFGEEVDTIGGGWNIVFTHIDKKGKLDWNLVTEMSALGNLIVDDQQNIVAAGRLNKEGSNYLRSVKLGDIELDEKIESVVVKISPKGAVKEVWGADFGTKGFESPIVVQNNKGEFFLGTEVWVGGGLKLNIRYKELPEVVKSGGAAVLGKIKF